MAGGSSRGLVAAVVSAASLALVCAVAAAAGPQQRAGSLKLARVGSFDAPVYVADAPGARKLLFVVDQPGSIEVGARRANAQARLPQHPRPRPL